MKISLENGMILWDWGGCRKLSRMKLFQIPIAWSVKRKTSF